MTLLIIVLLAAGLAAFTYGWLEPPPAQRGAATLRRHLLPLAARTVAWAALGVLLLDLSCARQAEPGRPLVLLDASLSMASDSGRWSEARDSARAWGEVRYFGDERPGTDSLPVHGRSRLGAALRTAAASDRPVIVVSDGEIEDAPDLPADLVRRAGVRLFQRRPGTDLAVTGFEAPPRVAQGDSIPLDITVTGYGTTLPDRVTIEVTADGRRVAERQISPAAGGTSIRIVLGSGSLRPGEILLSAGLSGFEDSESRNDARLRIVAVTPTPGVVLVANPGDWDSRALYRALVDVAQLPVRGYVQVVGGAWRSYRDLTPVPTEEVTRAARGADLLILKGDLSLAATTRARGLWLWPTEGGGMTALPGDWYVAAGGLSPISTALTGLPVDSFPPMTQVYPVQPQAEGWTGVTAQNGRRGAERPVITGVASGNRREIMMAADGWWRWAFRGGSSEQGYRTLVAATASWLLGGADSVTGRARPVRSVVSNQRPVIFQWLAAGTPPPLEIVWSRDSVTRRDTLRFDGAGRAEAWLDTGAWRYRLEGGGSGLVAVEPWSEEWLPRPVTLEPRADAAFAATAIPSRSRGWVWLFGICIVGLAAEWLGRRRLGLR